jgi:hypothetical protein
MQRFITRDPWESDKKIDVNWWLKDDCNYCDYRNSNKCDCCVYKKRKATFPMVY